MPRSPDCGKPQVPRRQAGTRLNRSDNSRRSARVRDHHRPSKQPDGSESGCGALLRRRGSPARKLGRRPRGRALPARNARVATDDARHAVVDAVRATAEALNASPAQTQLVEEMRRKLGEIKDLKKLDSN